MIRRAKSRHNGGVYLSSLPKHREQSSFRYHHSFESVRVLGKREVYYIGCGRKDPGTRATAQG